MEDPSTLITALGKLTLGTAGWVLAFLFFRDNKDKDAKLLALTERLATLVEGFRGDMANLKEAVKESK